MRKTKKILIILIVLLPTSLQALDTWVGWNLGSCTLTHDYIKSEGYASINILGIKIFDEDIQIGLSAMGISIPVSTNELNSISILPTEIYYSPFRFGDFMSIDIFTRGEIEKLDGNFNPRFSFGIRFGMLFRPQKDYIYYSPSLSLQTLGQTVPNYLGQVAVDIDFGFAVAGIAILPIAILSTIASDVREDYNNNDPYYDGEGSTSIY